VAAQKRATPRTIARRMNRWRLAIRPGRGRKQARLALGPATLGPVAPARAFNAYSYHATLNAHWGCDNALQGGYCVDRVFGSAPPRFWGGPMERRAERCMAAICWQQL